MSINSVNFDTYNVNDKKTLADKTSNANMDNSVFSPVSNTSNLAEQRGSVNNWINEKIGYKTGCTDDKDDGKLSFGEKLKSIGRGALNFVTNIVESVKEKPIQTLLTVGAVVAGSAVAVAAGIISAPALAIGGAAIGLVTGAVKIGKGISKASKAATDAEAKQAYESIGEGGATVAVSAFTMGKGIKVYKKGLNTARTSATESAKSAQKSSNSAKNSATKANEAVNSATQSAESASKSVTTATNAADDASNIAAQFMDDATRESNKLTAAQNAKSSSQEVLSSLEARSNIVKEATKSAQTNAEVSRTAAARASSASQTVQEALANTGNSAGMSSSAAREAAQCAREAAKASEKANRTLSLLRAQKAVQTGTNAAQRAAGAANVAANSADDAAKFASEAARAAGIAKDASQTAQKALSDIQSNYYYPIKGMSGSMAQKAVKAVAERKRTVSDLTDTEILNIWSHNQYKNSSLNAEMKQEIVSRFDELCRRHTIEISEGEVLMRTIPETPKIDTAGFSIGRPDGNGGNWPASVGRIGSSWNGDVPKEVITRIKADKLQQIQGAGANAPGEVTGSTLYVIEQPGGKISGFDWRRFGNITGENKFGSNHFRDAVDTNGYSTEINLPGNMKFELSKGQEITKTLQLEGGGINLGDLNLKIMRITPVK